MTVPPPTKYAVELPNTRRPGQTGIYRNALQPDSLIVTFRPDVTTLYDNFQYALKISAERPLLGHRPLNRSTGKHDPYSWQTYKQIAERVNNFGSGIMHLSDNVCKNPRSEQWAVGIYSYNRPGIYPNMFCLFFCANMSYNLITVALYDTLGSDVVEYVINHAEIKIVVTGVGHIPRLIQLAHKTPEMKVIVSMDNFDDDPLAAGSVLKAWAQEKGIRLLDFAEVEKIGQLHPRNHNIPSSNDIASICYTSGTTGVPKGAILLHANFIGSLSAAHVITNLRQDD
ncbi:11591_t:CDS:2, partial [Acaulospora colombiana]